MPSRPEALGVFEGRQPRRRSVQHSHFPRVFLLVVSVCASRCVQGVEGFARHQAAALAARGGGWRSGSPRSPAQRGLQCFPCFFSARENPRVQRGQWSPAKANPGGAIRTSSHGLSHGQTGRLIGVYTQSDRPSDVPTRAGPEDDKTEGCCAEGRRRAPQGTRRAPQGREKEPPRTVAHLPADLWPGIYYRRAAALLRLAAERQRSAAGIDFIVSAMATRGSSSSSSREIQYMPRLLVRRQLHVDGLDGVLHTLVRFGRARAASLGKGEARPSLSLCPPLFPERRRADVGRGCLRCVRRRRRFLPSKVDRKTTIGVKFRDNYMHYSWRRRPRRKPRRKALPREQAEP